MKMIKTMGMWGVMGLAALAACSVQAVTIDYISTSGSGIHFDGAGNFTFLPGSDNFQIVDGTAAGLLGEMTGLFSIGPVTTVGPVSSASVTGVGSFVIHDGSFDLVATLTWIEISQINAGYLNIHSSVNLTGIAYGGSNADLLALANNGVDYNLLKFNFNSTIDLAGLTATADDVSFSGRVSTAPISIPDGGSTLIFLGVALSGMAWANNRRKKQQPV